MNERLKRLYATLTATGIPGTRDAYPEGEAPSPPFFIYVVDSHGEVFADGSNYAELPRYRVILVERNADAEVEEKLLKAIQAVYGPVKVIEDWIAEERTRNVNYYFTDAKE